MLFSQHNICLLKRREIGNIISITFRLAQIKGEAGLLTEHFGPKTKVEARRCDFVCGPGAAAKPITINPGYGT